MSIKAVLFDLDGTLLPMDLDVYMKEYFVGLIGKMAANGYDDKLLMKAVYAGMHAMVNNDGSRTNEQALWAEMVNAFGEKVIEDKELFEDYYRVEFQDVKKVCGFNPKAAEVVRAIKAMGYRVILATNPMYPSIATESRIHWAGLELDDFEHFTTYEHYSSSKPNIKYYEEILKKMNLKAEECLMVGNDVEEDMITETIGMKVFLLPEDIINKNNKDISKYPQGTLDDLLVYVKSIS